jgi:hypothetical protein
MLTSKSGSTSQDTQIELKSNQFIIREHTLKYSLIYTEKFHTFITHDHYFYSDFILFKYNIFSCMGRDYKVRQSIKKSIHIDFRCIPVRLYTTYKESVVKSLIYQIP